jgi:uncharacterized protein YcaQ
MTVMLGELRRFAIARSLFAPTSLSEAIERLGFVQADPIRAPARAQDLTLRLRVADYVAGELERRYAELAIEEDYFINYGFLPRRHTMLMQPRTPRRVWDRATKQRANKVLAFVRERGEVHPRDLEKELSLGTVTNYWGGTSNAGTHLLDALHRRGLLRVLRRDSGVRVYALREQSELELSPAARADALLALVIDKYAPLPARSLGQLTSRLRLIAPQLATEFGPALTRAKKTLPHVQVDGHAWYWPGQITEAEESERVHFLAPFDPIVWDRGRFELLWDWAYRFEAYTPVKKRKLGYYALPLLFRDRVIGWGNLAYAEKNLTVELGFVSGKAPRERTFKRELEREIEHMRRFLALSGAESG